MHRGHLAEGRLGHVDVEALRLTDVRSTGNGTIKERTLRDFPNCLVKLLNIVGNGLNLLDTAIEGKEGILDVGVPQVLLNQVSNQMRVHTHELTCQHSSCVDI